MYEYEFKDYGTEPDLGRFSGNKLQIEDILNVRIKVLDFIVEDSTVKIGTKRLKLHFEKEGVKHIVFTGSKNLRDQIEKFPRERFPFNTTIVLQNKSLKFT